MDTEYAKTVYEDQKIVFGRTIKTYEALETKAKYVASALVAILSAISAYFLDNLPDFTNPQIGFIIGAVLCLGISAISVVLALWARPYQDGSFYNELFEDADLLKYYKEVSPKCVKNITINSDLNSQKARWLNRSIIFLLLFPFFGLLGLCFSYFSSSC